MITILIMDFDLGTALTHTNSSPWGTRISVRCWESQFLELTRTAVPPSPVKNPVSLYLGLAKLYHLYPSWCSSMSILSLWSFLLTSCQVSEIWARSILWFCSFSTRSLNFGKILLPFAEKMVGIGENWSKVWGSEEKDELEEDEEFKELSDVRVTLPSSCWIIQGFLDWSSSMIEEENTEELSKDIVRLPSSWGMSLRLLVEWLSSIFLACSMSEQLSSLLSFPRQWNSCE